MTHLESLARFVAGLTYEPIPERRLSRGYLRTAPDPVKRCGPISALRQDRADAIERIT